MPKPTPPATIYVASPDEYQAAVELAGTAPTPASVGNIRCATAGWTDATLVKDTAFYPRGARAAQARLAYYAVHFPFVEVDATYYALLPPTYAQNWLLWTPESFTFDIKSHPILTGHPINVARLPADLRDAITATGAETRVYADRLPAEIRLEIERRFCEFLNPLRQHGRLGAVHLQFPPWFTSSTKSVKHLERLAQEFGTLPLAVEFRHPSWTQPNTKARTLELLRQHRISLVCTDAPHAEDSPPPLFAVTNPKLALVRFHGHNTRGWEKKGASVHERFSYLYSPTQLKSWVSRLVQLAANAETVHATFNNCYRDYAVLNAKELAAVLATETGAHGPRPVTRVTNS